MRVGVEIGREYDIAFEFLGDVLKHVKTLGIEGVTDFVLVGFLIRIHGVASYLLGETEAYFENRCLDENGMTSTVK